MGIKYLNSYLKSACPKAIEHSKLDILNGKTIAVDISIYMYRYESTNRLLKNIGLMINAFKIHNIAPIYVFDGPPPIEKMSTLMQRRIKKQLMANEYAELAQNNNNNSRAQALKRQLVYIDNNKINQVKQLFDRTNSNYCTAPNEADAFCAYLVLSDQAWACLSEDTDLFVYGCTRVIRYFSLIHYTCVVYDMAKILNILNITQEEFTQICVISGSDYNPHNRCISLSENLSELFAQFLKFKQIKENDDKIKENNNKNHENFCGWLNSVNSCNINELALNNTIKIFQLSTSTNLLNDFSQLMTIV